MNHALRQGLTLLDREEKMWVESAPVLPFGSDVFALVDSRRRMEKIDPQQAALTLVNLTKKVEDVSKAVIAGLQASDSSRPQTPGTRPQANGDFAPLKVNRDPQLAAQQPEKLVRVLLRLRSALHLVGARSVPES
jgi:hypothetical protein